MKKGEIKVGDSKTMTWIDGRQMKMVLMQRMVMSLLPLMISSTRGDGLEK